MKKSSDQKRERLWVGAIVGGFCIWIVIIKAIFELMSWWQVALFSGVLLVCLCALLIFFAEADGDDEE